MSVSSKFGERQSWRRSGGSDAGKRKASKAILTALAVALLLFFAFWILRPRARPRMVAFVVSSSYDLDVIAPPLFAASATEELSEQLGAKIFSGDAATVRRALGSSKEISATLQDRDDTALFILRGYLLRNEDDEPCLACSDLSTRPDGTANRGLLPLSDVLTPLANSMPESFEGTRLVVLDVEPLSAHPSLNQWNDDAIEALAKTVSELKGDAPGRIWVIVTRGPMQSTGWDFRNGLPISTETLLAALDGEADFDEDRELSLDEVCTFIAGRYKRLPMRENTETPKLVVMRGGEGVVDTLAAGDALKDAWIAKAPPPAAEDDGTTSGEDGDEDGSTSETANRSSLPPIRLVAFQGDDQLTDGDSRQKDVPTTADEATPTATPTAEDDAPESTPAESTAESTGGGDKDAGSETLPPTFWDLRDRLERYDSDAINSLALAPHLWRHLVLKVLAAELQSLDPASPSDIPDQVAQDLIALQRIQNGEGGNLRITDDDAQKLQSLWQAFADVRKKQTVDRGIEAADALQQAIVIGRLRLWAWLEFERAAATGDGVALTDNKLLTELDRSERTLAESSGLMTPGIQSNLETRLTSLRRSLQLFDADVDNRVNDLLKEFAPRRAEQSWELTRRADAWLRSPLPNATQRRLLLQAVREAPVDPEDIEGPDQSDSSVSFAPEIASESARLRVSAFRSRLTRFNASVANTQADRNTVLTDVGSSTATFAETFDAALRVDPRLAISATDPKHIVHGLKPAPRIRKPSVIVRDEATGRPLAPGSVLRFETMEDAAKLVLDVAPDQPRETRYSIRYQIRSSESSIAIARARLEWRVAAEASDPDQPLAVTIPSDRRQSLPFQVRPLDWNAPAERVTLEIEVSPERTTDAVEGLPRSLSFPIELPRENHIRLFASSFQEDGCTDEIESHQSTLAGGLWLRTFNQRETSFQLELRNDAGKACRTQLWLIKLPNPYPELAGYWPDFAVDKYNALRSKMLDRNGRTYRRYLDGAPLLLGPATLSLPADQVRVPLDFRPPADPDAPAPPANQGSPSAVDVSHGMAVVCRFLDQNDQPLPQSDQIVPIVAKPWAPDSYVDTEVLFDDGDVRVSAEASKRIDGDRDDDQIPSHETNPIVMRWTQDDQWSSFANDQTEPPEDQDMNIPLGISVADIKVPVRPTRRSSWARLDVDGWPRAIQQQVVHQEGSLGTTRREPRATLASISVTRRDGGQKELKTESFHHPSDTVAFRGSGEQLLLAMQADFGEGTFNIRSEPQVRLFVEGQLRATYMTDRAIQTTATRLSPDGVFALKTTVTDLVATLPHAQRADDRIPIAIELWADGRKQAATGAEVILDSTAPSGITIQPNGATFVAPSNQAFNISVTDQGRKGSKIARIEMGLGLSSDEKIETQKRVHQVSPPANNPIIPRELRTFKFQLAQTYWVIVKAYDDAGNVSQKSARVILKKPKPVTPPVMSNGGQGDGKKPPAKLTKGILHGTIKTRTAMRGTLTLVGAPGDVTPSSSIEVSGANPSFRFGNLPEGKYTLEFDGTMGNKFKKKSWADQAVDLTPNQVKPVSLAP